LGLIIATVIMMAAGLTILFAWAKAAHLFK